MIEGIAMNNYQWNSSGKSVGKLVEMIEVSEVTALTTHVEALSRKIDNLSIQKSATVMVCKEYPFHRDGYSMMIPIHPHSSP